MANVSFSTLQMLMNLHREQWTQGLVMKRFEDHQASNEKTVEVTWKFMHEIVSCSCFFYFFYWGGGGALRREFSGVFEVWPRYYAAAG